MGSRSEEQIMSTEQTARLELLIGHVSDVLQPARTLVEQLQLRANASTTTRGELEFLKQISGGIFEQLAAIRDEAAALANQNSQGAQP
jgi:hypothetical protein